MNLIILTEQDAVDSQRYRLGDHRAEHICKILKVSAGDCLEVGLLNGPHGKGLVESIDDEQVVLNCQWTEEINLLPSIDLICALPRPQTLKKVLHSVAAMSVRRVYFIQGNRVKPRYFKSSLLKDNKFQRFLLEGLSQGKNTRLPEVTIHHYFKEFFEETLAELEESENVPAKKLLPDMEVKHYIDQIDLDSAQRIILAIGPEGGWVPFEQDFMRECGFEQFTLGPWTLRVENAVIAAIAQIQLTVKQGKSDS